MIRKECSRVPFAWTDCSKQMPGERCSWLTMTRSAPLMMKVPCSVIRGTSPMNTVSSRTSAWFFRRKVTCSAAVCDSPSFRLSKAGCLGGVISYFTKSKVQCPS